MDVNFINPFIQSATNVFSTMLNSPLERLRLSLKTTSTPSQEVSGVIGLSGKVSGSVVFSLSRSVAFAAVKQMLDIEVSELNSEVVDAIGELTNMIAGGAKASFPNEKLSIGLPNIIVGRNHAVMFPGNVQPICVDFRTLWGPVALEVGFDTRVNSVLVGGSRKAVPAL